MMARAHRYAGLVMAGFLVIAGLTGALLAWNNELDAAISPGLFSIDRPSALAEPLDPLILRQQVEAAYPQAFVARAPLVLASDRAVVFRLFELPNSMTEKKFELPNNQVFVNPYTGEILGERKWGDISQGIKNLMPFIYRLHFSLALDVVGEYVLGILALLWTLDCFVGAYLTFPARRKRSHLPFLSHHYPNGEHSWFRRWWKSWKVRWSGGSYKLNFDLHRAGGLWAWAMLFVFAWSSVAFNLSEVYEPVMKSAFAYQQDERSLPQLATAQLQPQIGWFEARNIGRKLMAAQAHELGFTVRHEEALIHDPGRGLYRYAVYSNRDIRNHGGSTSVYFDAETGALLKVWLPTGAASGDTVRTWLTSLHLAALWGVPMKLLVCAMGLLVAMLSVTGVVIWTRKTRIQARQ